MKKAKVEIKIEPYPKCGWYVVERVNNKVWWKSSNYQSLELAETRKKEREELKANIAKLLNKKLSKREIVRSGLAANPRVQQREFNARQRYLALFNEYSKQRKKQHKSKRKNEFKLSDIRELFGMQATTVDRAISNGQIKSTIGKTLSKGRWVRLFGYDDIKLYFEYLRGLKNGKPTSAMGTQNAQ